MPAGSGAGFIAPACPSVTACPMWWPQVDNRHQPEPVLTPEQAAQLCDRNFGIGGDGVRSCCARCAARRYAMLCSAAELLQGEQAWPPRGGGRVRERAAGAGEWGGGPSFQPRRAPCFKAPRGAPASLSAAQLERALPPLLRPPLQVIFALPPTNGTDYTMRIYNSDGSEPEM